ncbi:MAG: LON peptidase substrate-binding domain-containing protein [Rickettsiales bacterium]|nr:LON peptidase substrate-binding domain-containing protein [Rickettsiales bacterium]
METPFEAKTEIFPVLPLRDIVVFPSMVVPLFVGREKSVRALEDVVKREGKILLVTQKNGGVDDPKEGDIYRMGTIGNILQLLRLPDGTVKVLVEGIARAQVSDFFENKEFFQVIASLTEEQPGD